jgi:predicted nucleic acid-binding protein
MIYLDTSYITKCYLNEPHGERVRELARQAKGLACSHLGRVEFWCAVARHVREERISKDDAALIRALMAEDEANNIWTWFPVTSKLLNNVCAMLENLPDDAFIRSADAVHLTTAKDHGFTEVFSNDRHMLLCAAHFGIKGRNILE